MKNNNRRVERFSIGCSVCALHQVEYFPGGLLRWFDLGRVANKRIRSGGRWARAAAAAAASSLSLCNCLRVHQPCGCPFVIVAQQVSPGPPDHILVDLCTFKSYPSVPCRWLRVSRCKKKEGVFFMQLAISQRQRWPCNIAGNERMIPHTYDKN